jgi:hypothetical protein
VYICKKILSSHQCGRATTAPRPAQQRSDTPRTQSQTDRTQIPLQKFPTKFKPRHSIRKLRLNRIPPTHLRLHGLLPGLLRRRRRPAEVAEAVAGEAPAAAGPCEIPGLGVPCPAGPALGRFWFALCWVSDRVWVSPRRSLRSARSRRRRMWW